jgi:hypothetical protein
VTVRIAQIRAQKQIGHQNWASNVNFHRHFRAAGTTTLHRQYSSDRGKHGWQIGRVEPAAQPARVVTSRLLAPSLACDRTSWPNGTQI